MFQSDLAKGGIIIKITSSNIGMESERNYTEMHKDVIRIGIQKAGSGSGFPGSFAGYGKSKNPGKGRSFYQTLKDAAYQPNYKTGALQKLRQDTEREEQDVYYRIRTACIDYLLVLFLGIDPRELRERSIHTGLSFSSGLEMTYGEYHYHEESESTTFQTEGTVCTEDGRQVSFGLTLEMSRSFMEETAQEVRMGPVELSDPLVINLKDCPDVISDQVFSFDIDSDGVEDRISRLVEGAGFLALDKNEDGIINNGSELFGAESGNGFQDLSQYDEDKNGWIDENDSIFQKLKIWTKNHDGSNVLLSLKQADVGAVCLQSQATDFTVKDLMNNDTRARLRRSGVFLHESTGRPGLMHQYDLAKQAYA